MKVFAAVLSSLVLITSLTVHSKKAESKAKDGAKPEVLSVLSFYQFEDLSHKNQAEYLRGMRLMLIQMESGRLPSFAETKPGSLPFFMQQLIGPVVEADVQKEVVLGYLCSFAQVSQGRGQRKIIPDGQTLRVSAPLSCPEIVGFMCETSENAPIVKKGASGGSRVDWTIECPGKPEAQKPNVEASNLQPKLLHEECKYYEPNCEMLVGMTDKSAEDFRKKYQSYVASSNDRSCVIGGFISRLNSKGKCVPIESRKIGKKWKGQCGRGFTMCSPLVFGLESDGKPFCVLNDQFATTECASKSIKAGQTPEKVAGWLRGEEGPEPKPNREDLADAWVDFRKGLQNMCKPGDALEFHCNECYTMYSQLSRMNMFSTCANRCGVVFGETCREEFKGMGAKDKGQENQGEK